MIKINKKTVVLIIAVPIFALTGTAFVLRSTIHGLFVDKASVSNVPVFSFDQKTAPDWWAADNFNSQATVPKDYKGSEPVDTLPIAGRVISQGGTEAKPVNGCFVMFSYYNYSADIDAIRKAREAGMTDTSGLTMQVEGTRGMTINTIEGLKTYQLYHYGIAGPGSDTMMRGVELGYAALAHGYISVEGDCQEPSQLDATTSAVSAVSLTK